MKHLSLFLCFKYLCRKKMVLLSIVCVAMCCGLLIVVSSLFSGFIETLENSTGQTMGDVLIESLSDVKIPDYDVLIARLEKSPMVQAATAVLSTNGGLLYLGKGNVRGVYLWGIEVEKRAAIMPFTEYLLSEKKGRRPIRISDDQQTPKGFVGIGVVTKPDSVTDEYDFDKAGSFIGKKVKLITGTSSSQKPRDIRFDIADLVFSGVYQYDSNFVYLPIEDLTAALYPGKDKIADIIHITVPEGVDHARARDQVRDIWLKFAKDRYSVPLVDVETSRQRQAKLIAEYRKQMGMLMLIFGVVSAGVILLIFCIFYLLVMTKFKDIAIIKSCGLGTSATALLFVFFGLFVGISGSILGILAGWLVTTNVNPVERAVSSMLGLKLWKSSTYMFDEIPNAVYWEYVYWIAGAAVLAAAIGALVPAFAAARIRPVKILRYE